MKLKSIQDYLAAMARLENIFERARPGTPEGEEFERLSVSILDWERQNVVIERPKLAWKCPACGHRQPLTAEAVASAVATCKVCGAPLRRMPG